MFLALCAMCVHVTLAVLLLIAAIAALVRFRLKESYLLESLLLYFSQRPCQPGQQCRQSTWTNAANRKELSTGQEIAL